jgi:TRAP-type mannitol/chloroaromatic compound transport system permease small subunit
MGDLVRFWYAALFLFASAYTLLEEGHVRVDVFYAGSAPTQGRVNAFGAIVLGIRCAG